MVVDVVLPAVLGLVLVREAGVEAWGQLCQTDMRQLRIVEGIVGCFVPG